MTATASAVRPSVRNTPSPPRPNSVTSWPVLPSGRRGNAPLLDMTGHSGVCGARFQRAVSPWQVGYLPHTLILEENLSPVESNQYLGTVARGVASNLQPSPDALFSERQRP